MSGINGVSILWHAEHKKSDGRLVSRQGTVPPPKALNCLKYREMRQFVRDVWYYMLLCNYEKWRVAYAEKYPDKKINMKYRTGENVSKSIGGMIIDNFILGFRRLFCRA